MHHRSAQHINIIAQANCFFGEVRNVAQIIVVENFIFVVLKRVAYINQLLIIISHGEQFFFHMQKLQIKIAAHSVVKHKLLKLSYFIAHIFNCV